MSKNQKPPSSVIRANCELLVKREQVGNHKYGVNLEEANLSVKELLQHLLEEQLDGANYAQALLQKLGNIPTYQDGLKRGLEERDHLFDILKKEFRLSQGELRRLRSLYHAGAVLRGIHR